MRRLAAIMFTDVVGYTALTQSNEILALRIIERHRELVRPVFQKHLGREVKTVGDSFLVEFDSALEATECAVEMQRILREYNERNKETVLVRVGIHVGDVIHKDGDVYGDTVNIASRIEDISPGGGICLSEQVYDQVWNKIPYKLVKLQPQDLKNVAFPIDVYKIELPWEDSVAQEHDQHRLAVLPFANISADQRDEYFADGMTDELISTISKIGDLSVISRTSAMAYKGKGKRISEVGHELDVGTILEGSVRKAGNRLRITVQLIDVQGEKQLWSEKYDRDLEDVFAIQSEIAERVADALKVQLVPEKKQQIENRSTNNEEAYLLYLKGRHEWNNRTEEGLMKGIRYFERAIELDPNYAMAYTGVADCYVVLGNNGQLASSEAFPKAKTFALKALEIDASLAEPHASLSIVLSDYDWDWSGAERELRRAIAINPSYSTGHHWYAVQLNSMGRFDEALSEIRRAQELDPLSIVIKAVAGFQYALANQEERAVQELQRALQLDPTSFLLHGHLGLVYIKMSRFGEGIVEIQRALALSEGNASVTADLGYSYAMGGKRKEAFEIIEELREYSEKKYVSPWRLALIYVGLGEKDQAFELLYRAREERAGFLANALSIRGFDTIRSDQRFKALLKSMGLPASVSN